jgi:hypothetical protein
MAIFLVLIRRKTPFLNLLSFLGRGWSFNLLLLRRLRRENLRFWLALLLSLRLFVPFLLYIFLGIHHRQYNMLISDCALILIEFLSGVYEIVDVLLTALGKISGEEMMSQQFLVLFDCNEGDFSHNSLENP